VELDFAQPLGGALVEQEGIVGRVVAFRDFRKRARVEEIIGHELDDQGHVDMHGAFQLGQGADVFYGHFKIHVLFKSPGRDHVPEQVDDFFSLGGDLHLDHGVIQQVAPVLRLADRK
jgi:hypothetical protein